MGGTTWPGPSPSAVRTASAPDTLTAPDTQRFDAGALRLGAAAAVVVLAVTASGDWAIAAVLLGLLAAGPEGKWAGFTVALAGVASLGRWGSISLERIAGAQTVVGLGGWAGTSAVVAASWLAALALVCVAPKGWRAAAFGALAAVLVAGPQPAGSDALVRVGAVALGGVLAVGGAWAFHGYGRRRVPIAIGLGAAAAVLGWWR